VRSGKFPDRAFFFGEKMARLLTSNAMIRYFTLFCFFAASLLPGRANLGDTIAQLVAHYGKPTAYAEASDKTPFGNILFRAGAYEMLLFILDGKEVGARVSKIDKSAFTNDEIKTIMTAENSSGPWTPSVSGDPSLLSWSRSDHATVMYDQQKHMVLLTSAAMAQVVNGAKTATGQK
jgi:hypothetical protein